MQQKMKTQETFKKNSGYMNVQHVTNDFLIFTLSKTVKYVLQWWMKKVWCQRYYVAPSNRFWRDRIQVRLFSFITEVHICAAWPGQDPQDQPGKGTAAAVRIASPTSVCGLKPKWKREPTKKSIKWICLKVSASKNAWNKMSASINDKNTICFKTSA